MDKKKKTISSLFFLLNEAYIFSEKIHKINAVDNG